jgi:hypothetical protein
MPFRNINRILETYSLEADVSLLVCNPFSRSESQERVKNNITYVGIEEERVRSPGEGFGTHVEVLVIGRERDVPIILSLEVFHMLSVFGLNLLHPEVTSPNCFARVNAKLSFWQAQNTTYLQEDKSRS